MMNVIGGYISIVKRTEDNIDEVIELFSSLLDEENGVYVKSSSVNWVYDDYKHGVSHDGAVKITFAFYIESAEPIADGKTMFPSLFKKMNGQEIDLDEYVPIFIAFDHVDACHGVFENTEIRFSKDIGSSYKVISFEDSESHCVALNESRDMSFWADRAGVSK